MTDVYKVNELDLQDLENTLQRLSNDVVNSLKSIQARSDYYRQCVS